jgi:predicted GNAT family N-acyltransferase
LHQNSDLAADGLRFENRPPPVADFIRMRADCGWGEDAPEVCGPALETSLAAITVLDVQDRIVGFVRAIGDPLYIYIQDAVIAPGLRGKGLGGRLMRHFLAQLTGNYPHATIMLMAEKGRERFYIELGFEVRPGETFGPGMQLRR